MLEFNRLYKLLEVETWTGKIPLSVNSLETVLTSIVPYEPIFTSKPSIFFIEIRAVLIEMEVEFSTVTFPVLSINKLYFPFSSLENAALFSSIVSFKLASETWVFSLE